MVRITARCMWGLLSRDQFPKRPHPSTSYPRAALSPSPHSTIFVEMGSIDKKSDEKHGHLSIGSQQVDSGAQLDASPHTQLDRVNA